MPIEAMLPLAKSDVVEREQWFVTPRIHVYRALRRLILRNVSELAAVCALWLCSKSRTH